MRLRSCKPGIHVRHIDNVPVGGTFEKPEAEVWGTSIVRKHSLLLLNLICLCGVAVVAAPVLAGEPAQPLAAQTYARDAGQDIDKTYTALIDKYTTRKDFNSPLTDYLPASDTVPTPLDVLGHIAGAPDYLPYTADVHRYFRKLASSTPRVRVFSIGRSEEGHEMIAVAVADEKLLDDLDANRARLAKLADPRLIELDDARADKLIEHTAPVYYITGALHSNETGSPTALMELAYRLAVDDAPWIKQIRENVVTLITPVVETDGRDRQVDIYNWHLAHPDQNIPPLMYWGHYIAHDNNRDAMAMTLNLTRNIADTYLGWHAQVLHDLHESRAYLYDNTIGTGPYNAWFDPILVGELQELAWNNVQQVTKLGMPGVYTHGKFDTWSPGYLLFIANMHNGIGRLYETFSNHGADTQKRILDPRKYERTWYKPNPPLPVAMWSQRNNNNYTQTGLLVTLHHFSTRAPVFLKNFYLKGKRSVRKPQLAGPAAWILPADNTRRGSLARLLRVLQQQHVEISRTTGPVTVQVAPPQARNEGAGKDKSGRAKPQQRRFAAGSYVVRMDQPYSGIANTLLDRQYWAPEDPYDKPYDDTGWSMGDLFAVDVVRITDLAILKASMQPVPVPVDVPQGIAGVDAAAGKLPRIAIMHTWLNTETEGWWRQALDKMDVAYDYISTQDVSRDGDLRSKYDAILFAPVGRIGVHPLRKTQVGTRQIIDGLPMYGKPLPWQTTDLTPNIGKIDSTPDMRPGLGYSGVENLKRFVSAGGLLITAQDTARFAIDIGLAPGVFVTPRKDLKVVGSVLQASFADRHGPVAAGYDSDDLAVYSAKGLSFTVSNSTRGSEGIPTANDFKRVTGRGGPDDVDIPEGRSFAKPPALPQVKPWQAVPFNEDQARDNHWLIPEGLRPRTVLHFAAEEQLLLSGLLDHGDELAERAAVVHARYGKGHVLLFAINPIWRGETIGSYALVLNALTQFHRLGEHTSRAAAQE